MKVKIDRGVEMPMRRNDKGKYPWALMEIGDSFLAPGVKSPAHIATSRDWAQKSMGKKFTARTTPEGVRVWRVA